MVYIRLNRVYFLYLHAIRLYHVAFLQGVQQLQQVVDVIFGELEAAQVHSETAHRQRPVLLKSPPLKGSLLVRSLRHI